MGACSCTERDRSEKFSLTPVEHEQDDVQVIREIPSVSRVVSSASSVTDAAFDESSFCCCLHGIIALHKSKGPALKQKIQLVRQQSKSFREKHANIVKGKVELVRQASKRLLRKITSRKLDPSTLPFKEPIHLTGLFSNWKTLPEAKMLVVPGGREGFVTCKLCLKLTSESFSFAVVSGTRGWDWRLYPRDAVAIVMMFIKTHVSKKGVMDPDDPDKVVVGIGNASIGHGLNFHVLEEEGAVVTIWLEVPVRPNEEAGVLELRVDTAEGAKVWYSRADTGVQLDAGDGMDLSNYRSYLPPRKKKGLAV